MTVKVVLVLVVVFSHILAERRGSLLSLIQVYRHGERSPIMFSPNDPYQDFRYWNTTPGDLTNRGKLQQFQLGQYTRKRYGRFIPRLYLKTDFLVQSTNTDRTFMSAASNVAGLYPPVGPQVWLPIIRWQPIPVFPVDEAVLSSYSSCTAYINAVSRLFSTDELFVRVSEESQELFAYLTEHTGTNVVSLYQVLLIWDALNIENLQGFPLPEWTQSVFPEPLANLSTYFYLASSYTEELKVLTTGPFFNALIQHFEAISTNSSQVQKHLQYSGHDINLAVILNTLGAYDPPHIPGFASTIYFELREGRNENYINIYYSNVTGAEPVPITLSGCDFDCSLQDFDSILGNRTITPDEWYTLCNVTTR